MSDRLYIAVPVYNRMKLASLCVPTIRAGMKHGEDVLVVYDDGSTEEMPMELVSAADGIVRTDSAGIDAQRRKHILEFWGNREIHGCSHLYLCDSDAIHDINWRETMLDLQAEYKAPICGYRTRTHADYENNVFRDNPTEWVIWQRFSPGVSLLLDMGMVERVVKLIPERWAWDWAIAGMLDYKMAVTRTSYVDHVGHLGMHDENQKPGHVSPERALNPTSFLIEKRKEVLAKLGLKEHE